MTYPRLAAWLLLSLVGACHPDTSLAVEEDALGTIDCSTGDPCVIGYHRGNRCATRNAADGTSCSDNVCYPATCQQGACTPAAPLDCDDHNPCTDDSCVSGCIHAVNSAACDDGNACTVASQCSGGACVGLGPTAGTPGPVGGFTIAASAPAPGDVLVRPGNGSAPPIYYVQGGAIDLAVTLPNCGWVTSVRLGAVELGTAPRTQCDDTHPAYDCEPNYYEVVGDAPHSDGTHTLTLRLHVVNAGRGDSYTVTLGATSAVDSASHAVTLVMVATVGHQSGGGLMQVTISEAELRDALVSTLLDNFKGNYATGQMLDIWFDDPLAIDSGAIAVHSTFDFPLVLCTGSASVRGRFHLTVSNHEAFVVWDTPPTAGVSAPIGCVVDQLAIIAAENQIQDRFRATIESEFPKNFDPFGSLLLDVQVQSKRLAVSVTQPLASIGIDVTYGAPGIRTPGQTGPAFHDGEFLGLFPSGLAHVCRDTPDGDLANCAAVDIAPDGLFDWNAPDGAPNAPPVPDPWAHNPPDGYQYEEQRARNALVGFRRELSSLPRPDRNPGALLVAGSGQRPVALPLPCGVATRGEGLLSFGANESASLLGGVAATGGYRVLITFANYTGQDCQ